MSEGESQRAIDLIKAACVEAGIPEQGDALRSVLQNIGCQVRDPRNAGMLKGAVGFPVDFNVEVEPDKILAFQAIVAEAVQVASTLLGDSGL